MAPNKSRKAKKSTRRPRRRVANKRPGNASIGQMVVMNKVPDKPMRFVKSIYGSQSLSGVGSAQIGTVAFTMNMLADFNDIAILFNRYKLNKIITTFTLRSSSGTAGGLSNSTQLPKIFVRYNYDANLSGIVPQTLQEASNVINHTFTEDSTILRYTCVPRTIAPVYRSAISTGYELQKKSYIDSQYSDVPHYGLMYWIPFLAVGDEILIDYTFDFTVKYQL